MRFKKYLLPANALFLLVFILGFAALAGALVLSAAPALDSDWEIMDNESELNLDPQAEKASEQTGFLEDELPAPEVADFNDVYLINCDVLEIEYNEPITAAQAKALFTIKVDGVEAEWEFLSYFDFGSYADRGGVVNVRLIEPLDTGEPRGRRRETAAESYLARTEHIMGPAAAERITVGVGTETKEAEWKTFYTERSLGHMSRVYAYASAEAGNNGQRIKDWADSNDGNIFSADAQPLYTDEFIARQVAEGMHRFCGRSEFLTLPFVDSGFKALLVGASQSVYEAPEFRELYVCGETTDTYTRTSIKATDVPGNFLGNGKYKKPFIVGTADDIMRHYSPLKADGTSASGNADSARPRSDHFHFGEAFFDIYYEIGVKVGCPRFPLGPDNDPDDYRFDLQLVKFYNNAKAAGKWPGTAMMDSVKDYYLYGAMIHWEFIPESQEFKEKTFPVNTRAELYKYDYDLYYALSGIYGKYEFWTGVGNLQGASTTDDTTKYRTPWFWHNQPDNYGLPATVSGTSGVPYEPLKIISATVVAHNQIDVVFNREIKTVANVATPSNWMIYIDGVPVKGVVLENNGYNWKSIRLQTQCQVNFATGEATTVESDNERNVSYPENRLDNGKPYGRYFAGFSKSDLDERSIANGGWILNDQVLGVNSLEFGEFVSVEEAIKRGADKVGKVEIEYIGSADVEAWDGSILTKNTKFEATGFRPWIGHAYRSPLTGLYIYLDAAVGDNPDYDAEMVAMVGAQVYEAHLQNNAYTIYPTSAGGADFDKAFGSGSGSFTSTSGANQYSAAKWEDGFLGVSSSSLTLPTTMPITNDSVVYDRVGQRIADGAVRGNGGMIVAAGSILGNHPGQQPQSNGLRGTNVGDSYRVEGWGGTTFQTEDVLVMRDYNLCRYRNEALIMHEGGHGIDSFTNGAANYAQNIYNDISAAWATAASPVNGARWADVDNLAAYCGTRSEYTSTLPTFYAGVMREQMMGVNDSTWTPMSTRTELFRYDPYGFEVFKRIFFADELHLWYENKIGDPAYRVMPEDWEILRDTYPEFSHWKGVDDLIQWGYSIPQVARYNPYTEKLNSLPVKSQLNNAVKWVSWNVPDVWGPEPYKEPTNIDYPNNRYDFVGGSSYFPIPDFDDPDGLEPLKNQEHPFARSGGVIKPMRTPLIAALAAPVCGTVVDDSTKILSRPVLVQFDLEDYDGKITSNNVSTSFELKKNGKYTHFYYWSFDKDEETDVATVTIRLDWPLEKDDIVEVIAVDLVKITMVANGGVIGDKPAITRNFAIDGKYIDLPLPTRSGYGFIGWFTAMTGGTMITAESIVSNDVTTLYARWTEGYQVILDVNGGTLPVGITSPITLTSASTLADLPIPTHPNEKLEFVGWKLSGKFIDESDVETGVTDAIIAGKTLVAHYSLKVKPDLGNEYLNENVQKFPDMWDFEKEQTKSAFSTASDRLIYEEVWIEVPCDVDGDGKRDLIRARFKRPIETKPEYGGLKTPVTAEVTPYSNTFAALGGALGGKVDIDFPGEDNPDTRHLTYADIRYDGPRYKDLLDPVTGKIKATGLFAPYGIPDARIPLSSQPEGSATASWNNAASTGWQAYFIPLGYTCAHLTIIGSNYGEGFLTYGDYNENLCSAALVDWLNGRVKGYSDPTGLVEVLPPYWATGEVAMAGQSYNGTLPFAAAITGVEGLKTIIPSAPVTSSYEYYRTNGGVYSPGNCQGEDVSDIIGYCFGRGWASWSASDPANGPTSPVFSTFNSSFFDPAKTIFERFYEYLEDAFDNQDRITGDYSKWWDARNQVSFGDDIREDLGIIMLHGFNDDNVKFKNTALINDMADRYGITAKAIFHQGRHMTPHDHFGLNFYSDIHKWYDHYLYGVENGMPDAFPDVRVQSNVDISWKEYDHWPMGVYQKFYPTGTGRVGTLSFTPQTTSIELPFKDAFILGLTRPEQPIPTAPTWDPLYTEYATKLGGHGIRQMAADQTSRWRNYMFGGGDNTSLWTYNWTAPASGVTYDLTTSIDDRVLYVMDVTEEMRISGAIKMTAKVKADKKVGSISAMLVDFGNELRYGSGTSVTDTVTAPHGLPVNLVSFIKDANPTPARIIARGSVDVQNPNWDGKIWNECREQNWMPNYTFQTTAITPGTFYPYTWEMNVMDYTVLAGHKLVLMIFGSDPEYTLRPFNPTGFTVEVGPDTYLSLPIVGYEPAAPTITGPTAMELTAGYTATSTGEYTITGIPPATVTKVSGDAAITWNSTTKKLDIAAGLSAGTYKVELKAANGISPDGTITFTLTVKSGDGSSTGGGSTGGGDIIIGPLKPSLRNILGNDTQGPTFKDVPETHWAYQYVEYLARRDYVKGKSATLYAPSDPITRAEFVTILARMEGAAQTDYSGPFTDVVPGSYYAGAVDWAVKAGVTIGTSDTTFSPGRTISRQEIAAMLARYVTYKLVTLVAYNQPISFTDEAQIAAYAKDYVRNMQTADVINGYPDGSFKPLANATRAEAAKMLALVHYLMNYK